MFRVSVLLCCNVDYSALGSLLGWNVVCNFVCCISFECMCYFVFFFVYCSTTATRYITTCSYYYYYYYYYYYWRRILSILNVLNLHMPNSTVSKLFFSKSILLQMTHYARSFHYGVTIKITPSVCTHEPENWTHPTNIIVTLSTICPLPTPHHL
jgi:hypothetical protein